MSSKQQIYVFGSNLAGRHGRGSAAVAFNKHGAQYGVGFGPQGNSFAIPTKNADLGVLDLKQIEYYVECFTLYAVSNQQMHFNVVEIGCGLAGYKPEQIAPMFVAAYTLPNVTLPSSFVEVIRSRLSDEALRQLKSMTPLE